MKTFKALVCVLFAILSTTVCAQTTNNKDNLLVVQLQDGTEVEYVYEDIVKIVARQQNPDTVPGATVDLGLSVLWADRNVGATSPEQAGGHYAWGETEEKVVYSNNYTYVKNNIDTTEISGTEFDVAHVKWGSDWRMPTYDELCELKNNCTWTLATQNNVDGFLVTSNNGNSIFLPAAGYYWDKNFYRYAWAYWSSTQYDDIYSHSMVRGEVNYISPFDAGCSVRPVATSAHTATQTETQAASEYLAIAMSDGTEHKYPVNNIKKMYFKYSDYISLGQGTFIDQIFGVKYQVEVKQSKLDPNKFAIKNPYKQAAKLYKNSDVTTYDDQSDYMEIEVLNVGDSLNHVLIAQNDLVYFSPTCTGIDLLNYGKSVTVYHPSTYTATSDSLNYSYNHILKRQSNGLPRQINLAPIYYMDGIGGYTSYVNTEGVIKIIFPGCDPVDFSAEVKYLGTLSTPDGTNYAMGNITISADVDEARVALVQSKKPNEAYNAVLNSLVETTTITESGEVKLPLDSFGTYILIAVTYSDGIAKDYDYVKFNYENSALWETIGTGLFTDPFLYQFLEDSDGNVIDQPTYEVTIQENVVTPGIYRIKHPYSANTYPYDLGNSLDDTNSNSYDMIIDASDSTAVYFGLTDIGIEDDIELLSLGGYYIEQGKTFDEVKADNGINATLKNGIINFAAKEILYTTMSAYENGTTYTANSNKAEDMVTLPSAVSTETTAKAHATRKATAKKKCYFNKSVVGTDSTKRKLTFKSLGSSKEISTCAHK